MSKPLTLRNDGQPVLHCFPAWLEERAKREGVELQPWQREVAQAFADGVSVSVHASAGRQGGKHWLYDNLRDFINELSEGDVPS